MILSLARLTHIATFFSIFFSLAAVSIAATPPAVTSGTLVAQFQADESFLSLDGSGTDVASWTAANDNSIVLTRTGSAASNSNISFDSSEMGGNGAVLVNDFSGDNLVLQGAMPGTRTATTVFFLGHFSPGRDGSFTDATFGQYIYSYGADGADGTQLDLQTEAGNAELFGGAGTQIVGNISGNVGNYTIYRVEYGGGSGADWAVYANDSLVGSGTNGGNYSVSGDLILFGYQNSGGASGGFNFVGNVGELLFYDGVLDSTDVAAVESYLAGRIIPEPSTFVLSVLGLIGCAVYRNRR